MHRLVGLHIRYTQSPFEVLERAEQLHVPIAQMFMHDESGVAANLNDADRKEFVKKRTALFNYLVAHGSYKINCADPQRTYHPALEHEAKRAESFECTHMVLHAGASDDIEQGIDALARLAINFSRKHSNLKLVFENTAFAGPSLGGNIVHFAKLLEKLDKPEIVSFCIDTAHAHAAGYDIIDKQNEFFHQLESTIGMDRIALIHLNDTSVAQGSHEDVHEPFGDGKIGIETLRVFALNEKLAGIPLILELPVLPLAREQQTLDLVNSWFQKKEIKI